jgi:hypothetical protein
MSTFSRLDELHKHPSMMRELTRPIVFFFDTHFGDGGPADNSEPNKEIFKSAWGFYGLWTKVGGGDNVELWQFDRDEIKHHYQFDLQVKGNHDWELDLPESILLIVDGMKILVTHGHAGDLLNDRLRGVGRFFTRYVWKPLEQIGLKQPPTNPYRHETQRKALIEWANSREVIHVHGHIHLLERNGFDIDGGNSVEPGILQCVELTGSGFHRVHWTKEGRREL